MPGKISEDFLNELRNKNDIVNVISPYVELRKRGRIYVGLCPFHNEKTPSFTVYPDNQSFFCFGCGAGGEIIAFTKKIENIDFIDAVKSLAEKCGMVLPNEGIDDSMIVKRKRIYEMNKEAAKFFHNELMSSSGKLAYDYCIARGYTPKTINHFGLGYAPDSWRNLITHLHKLNYSYEEMVEADLAKKSVKDGKIRFYDNFRNRVIVPIIDVRGRIVAFGGRVLDDSKPKYINSSDTLVYKKSLGVFGLNFAKNGNEKKLILVEGYMDVIALHQAGFTNAVAALGTAFTPEMASLLSRYSEEILICFDNDEAGHKATEKAIKIFSSVGIKVRVIKMTGGKDADEIIKKYGPEKFKSFITGATNDIEYKILEERGKFDIESPDGKLSFIKSVAGILAQTSDVFARDIYSAKISSELGINKETLLSQINLQAGKIKRNTTKEKFNSMMKVTGSVEEKANSMKKQYVMAANAEEAILSLLMRNSDFYCKIKDEISSDDFVTDFNKRLFLILREQIENGMSVELTSIINYGLNDDEISYTKYIQLKSDNLKNTIDECRNFISILKKEKERIDNSVSVVGALDDDDFLSAFENLKKQKK